MKIGSSREEHKLHTLIDHGSDIAICLDHHMDSKKLAALTKNNRQILSKYKIHGTPSLKRGILVLVKKSSGCTLTNVQSHHNNDILSFNIVLPDLTVINVTAVYAPTDDLPGFWDKVQEISNTGNHDHKLIVGDYNVTLDHEMDSYGYKTDPHPKSRKVINGWLEQESLIDSYRYFHDQTRSYTYRTSNCHLKSRLDYCLMSPCIIPFVKDVTHMANNYINTDHATLVIDIDTTNTCKGKGTFRSPPNAHNDPIYVKLIKNTIKRALYSCLVKNQRTDLEIALLESRIKLEEELYSLETKVPSWNTYQRQNSLKLTISILLSNEPTNEILVNRDTTISKPNLLEFILQKMKDDTIIFARNQKKTNTKTSSELKETLQSLLSEPESLENTMYILDTQNRLETHETTLMHDTLSKKANFNLLENERPSRSFLNMENSRSGYSEITKLRIPNPNYDKLIPESPNNMSHFTITNQDLIRYNMTDAFQNVFFQQPSLTTDTKDIIDFLNSDGDTKPMEELRKRQLSYTESLQMEGLLTHTELSKALFFHMKGSSSPGIDGFTVNHMRVFWDDLGHIVTQGLNGSFGGELTTSLRKAVIKLLRKGSKDPTLCGNYRPISLLSIFYKLASCAISLRIEPAVTQIIGRQQKAYLKTNNIGSVLLNLINLIKHVNEKKKSAIILLIDFRKAFDSIDHTFLHNTLNLLGFGPDIRGWIKLFLTNREAQILMGGHMSSPIKLEQGVPQGDVVSPFIFILMVEILLLKINYTKNLTGIIFATYEARSETFADDTTIFLTRSAHNLTYAAKYIKAFHQISGLACNLDKTIVVPIGKKNDKNDILCPELGMVWDDTFTILGFTIDSKLKKLNDNFQNIKEKILNQIKAWTPYNLSLRGRITISKTKLTPQITYVATVLEMDEKTTDSIQELINSFVLNIKPGGRHWISKDLLYEPQKNGGFGIINLKDFTLAIKCSWIKRYTIDKLDDHWADLLDTLLDKTPDTRTEILNYGPERFNQLIKLNLPGLSQIFEAYKSVKTKFPTQPESLDNTWLCQNIFFNPTFTRKIPNKKKKNIFLKPTFYGIPDKYHTLTVKDLYPGGKFISELALNSLTNTKLVPMNYKNLKAHVTTKIGLNKFYDAIPLMNLPQKKHTHSNITSFLQSIKKGSGKYRAILHKKLNPKDLHSPSNWKSKLNDPTITSEHIKQARKNLTSRYLGSDSVDTLSRLKLGKTYFGTQLIHIDPTNTIHCKTCLRETESEIEEDLTHATFHCPHVHNIITNISDHYFPGLNTPLNPKDTTLSILEDLHPLYSGKPGQVLMSIIWDLNLCYLMTCRNKEKTPTPEPAINFIKQGVSRILKLLPNTMVAKHIYNCDTLIDLFS